eukprot:jgi/Chlat1/3111/Chrsp21S00244
MAASVSCLAQVSGRGLVTSGRGSGSLGGLRFPSSRRSAQSARLVPRQAQTQALFGWGRKAKVQVNDKAKEAKDELRKAVEGTERGVLTQNDRDGRRDAIVQCVEALEELGKGSETTGADSLSATWRLLWTTEKETLFLLQRAGLFGTNAGESYQAKFPPSGAFVVDATIEVSGPQRITFKFDKARLKTDKLNWALPPFGKGWFDTVYLDNDLRIARDIRGDILVVERCKTPWQGV